MAGPVDFIGKFFRRGRTPSQPHRDTLSYPQMMQLGSPRNDRKRPVFKPVARNLRMFSRTPYARRAINTIKNPIAGHAWEIRAKKGVKLNRALEEQIEVATYCFEHPNVDDSFETLIEQVVEDLLCGAGAIEVQVGADPLRPLWMWPVDGLSIQQFAGWAGGANEARYYQTHGYGGLGNISNDGIPLRNDELIYIKPNPTTSNPFGTGPLEVAFMSIARQLGVAEFAGNVSSNAKPPGMLFFEDAADEWLNAFRAYWRNEIEGQGNMPMAGGKSAQYLRLYPEGDKAMYLEYQRFQVREIATSFDISPQNLGIEADVNRSTSEVAEDRDWDAAIKPTARKVSSHLTREALHRKLGFYQLEHRYVGLDREDEEATADIYAIYYKNNAITPNEQREKLGLPPSKSQWGDLTAADVEIAVQAARSMATNLDDDLPDGGQTTPGAKPASKSKPSPDKKPTEAK